MRVIIAGLDFPTISQTLGALLPGVEVAHVPPGDLAQEAARAEVLIPAMCRVDQSIIAPAGQAGRLALIQQWGVGLEGVDLAAAARWGVAVANVPGDAAPANAESTAEHALFLMMAAARRINQCRQSFACGPWGFPQGRALFGATAVIMGLGRVGQALARRLKALGLTVWGVRREPDPELAARLGLAGVVGAADLPGLLPRADFLVSAVTATPATLGCFNRQVFAALPPGAVFVNVSRGGVVNEDDLQAALVAGHLAGAGLDVFAREPARADHPLVALPQVVATPHVGGVTRQSYADIGREVAANIRRLAAGQPLAHLAPGS
ncbi:MAG: hydroxyacid dehydrogenase [Deltaproteobacteria bacterium]|nr:hydroxyacid dehydrogenase [Deltaproteobacteria bacterium]